MIKQINNLSDIDRAESFLLKFLDGIDICEEDRRFLKESISAFVNAYRALIIQTQSSKSLT